MTKNDIGLLKPYERPYGQTALPDSRVFKGDLLAAAIQVRRALDRDERGRWS